MVKKRKVATKRFIDSLCNVLSSKKAEDIKIINTTKKTSEFDYMVIVTANGKYHIEAIADEVEKFIENNNITVLGKDVNPETGWIVFDLVHTVIHIMSPEVREYYSLERIWETPK
ncbi:MAG: ribosome silencing factor [Brevinematia bacterium]